MTGGFDASLTLMWAGALDEAFHVIEQELRDFLSQGAPNEAIRSIEQALREKQAIFATGAFDALLTLV